MADRTLKELTEFVTARPDLPWGEFSCTPVLEFDQKGKSLTTVKRCAITAGGVTAVVRLPHQVTIGKGLSWPPESVRNAMLEALGPTVPEA